MDSILETIKKTFTGMSVKVCVITALILLALILLAYLIGPKVDQNPKAKGLVTVFKMRLSEFVISSLGISGFMLVYWFLGGLLPDNQLLATDVLLPFVLILAGKVMFKAMKRVNTPEKVGGEEVPTENNSKFLILVTLIYLTVIGFISYATNSSADFKPAKNTGMVLAALILGRFFWFDSTFKGFKEELAGFIPAKSYGWELGISVLIVSGIVIYAMTREASMQYGIFYGMIFGVAAGIIAAVAITNYQRRKEN